MRQTVSPSEIIISDDGSTDGTWGLLEEFRASSAVPCVLLRNPGERGFQANFTNALKASTGDLICLADQDDIWLDRHIEALVSDLQTRSVAVVASDSLCVDVAGRELGWTLFEAERLSHRRARRSAGASCAAFHTVMIHSAPVGHGMAFRRDLLDTVLPLPPEWLHDRWIFAVGSALSAVAYRLEPLARYRQHANNASGGARRSLSDLRRSDRITGGTHIVQAPRTAQLMVLQDRVRSTASDCKLGVIAGMLEFALQRERVRRSGRVRGLAIVLRSGLRGDYIRWSRGALAFVRDILAVTR